MQFVWPEWRKGFPREKTKDRIRLAGQMLNQGQLVQPRGPNICPWDILILRQLPWHLLLMLERRFCSEFQWLLLDQFFMEWKQLCFEILLIDQVDWGMTLSPSWEKNIAHKLHGTERVLLIYVGSVYLHLYQSLVKGTDLRNTRHCQVLNQTPKPGSKEQFENACDIFSTWAIFIGLPKGAQ